MSNWREKIDSGITDDEQPDIFGRSESREEIKRRLKEERRQKRIAEQEALRQARQAQKEADKKGHRIDIVFFSVLIGAVVLVLIGGFAIQSIKDKENTKFEQDPGKSSFYYAEAVPELKDDGVSAVIKEAYYTNGGYLCVKMVLGNGTAQSQHPTGIHIELRNGEDEKIASGNTENIRENFHIAPGEYSDYTVMIPPEYVAIDDDPLEMLSYSINISATPVE